MHNSQTDLQATQSIIDIFERSKAHSDEALESLPGIYAVIDSNGNILKGNKNLALFFCVNHENLLGRNIQQILHEEERLLFKSKIENFKSARVEGFEFKANIVTLEGEKLNFLWDLNVLKTDRADLPLLFSLIGRDVTDLTRTTEQKTRMQIELNTAKTVQDSFFQPPTASFGNSSVSGFYEPANECGGDWWHYCMMKERLFLWIGDVTGHGVPAALVVSAVNAVVSTISGTKMSPSEALSVLNNAIHSTAKDQLGMTFFIASIDLESRVCSYASAAHEPAVLIRQGQTPPTVQDFKMLGISPGLPLGVTKNVVFEETKIQLNQGDRIFLYTDGLRDLFNSLGKNRQSLRFYKELANLASKYQSPLDLAHGFQNKLNEVRGGAPLQDDVTFLVFKLG